MHNCMASRSLALGGLVERFSVCCEVRGFSLLITCTLYRYRLQFYTCYQSDTDTKKKANITDNRSDYRCNTKHQQS